MIHLLEKVGVTFVDSAVCLHLFRVSLKVLLLTEVKLYSVIFIYVVSCRKKSVML